jgi:hypothetical protein
MQASSGHVDADVLGRRQFDLAPLTIAVVAAYIVIGIIITEGERLPIDSVQINLHSIHLFCNLCIFKGIIRYRTEKYNSLWTAGTFLSLKSGIFPSPCHDTAQPIAYA